MRPGQQFHPFGEIGVTGNRAVVVPVGSDQVGQHLGVARIGLRSRRRVAVPIARGCHRVNRIDLVASRQQRPDHQTPVDLDPDDESMELADPGHAVGDAAFAQHHAVLRHHADIVMVLCPVHSHKEHCISSRS
jgi:hypothetical protein